MKPTHTRNIEKEVLLLNANGFEQLVQDIFSALPGWSASRNDTNAKDFGVDVLAKSPNGVTYGIQCKHYLSKNSTVGVETVGYLAGALGFHRAEHGIIIASHNPQTSTQEENYTKDAKTLAAVNEVKLWGLKELQMLADAASSGSPKNLILLDLDYEVSPKSLRPRWVDYLIVGGLALGLLVGAITVVLNSLGRQGAQPTQQAGTSQQPGNSQQPFTITPLQSQITAEQSAGISNAVKLYDLGYQEALWTGDTSQAQAIMSIELYQEFLSMQNRYTNRGCRVLTQEISPAVITSIELQSPQQAKVKVRKNWQQTLYCQGSNPSLLSNGPFSVTYQIAQDRDDRWIVTDSSLL